MKRLFVLLQVLFVLNINAAKATETKEVKMDKLIERDLLFGNPEKSAVKLSPNGQYISFLDPYKGVMNIWIAPKADLSAAKCISKETKRNLRNYGWTYDSKNLVYLQDDGGNENWYVNITNIDSGQHRAITPKEGVHATGVSTSRSDHENVVVYHNQRHSKYHDVYKVNLATGKTEMLYQNNDGYNGFLLDNDFTLKVAYKIAQAEMKTEIYCFTDPSDYSKTRLIKSAGIYDMESTHPLSMTIDGKTLYIADSTNRNSSALVEINLETFAEKELHYDAKTDIGGTIRDPKTDKVQAVYNTYLREKISILDEAIKQDIDHLKQLHDGMMVVTSRTLDDKLWIVAYSQDNYPVKYYLYNRDASEPIAEYLFSSNSAQEGLPLAKMHGREIKTRDGLTMTAYLTLPNWLDDGEGVPNKPLPMVLNVHGGPAVRDSWGFNPLHQLLANRGYAVLSVNYRGSSGFGKDFLNAGDGQWGLKMHDDLIDAVDWAINNKIADKEKVAIFGGSYGGYATLVGMTKTPDVFAAGVDIVGVSNLTTFLDSIPPYWEPYIKLLHKRIGGDPATEEGKKTLKERSPVYHAQNIKKPLLIAQGANDPRVNQDESEQIVSAMQKNKVPVLYLLYPKEGHGFGEVQNKLSFYAQTEIFLAKFLGGRFQAENNTYPKANYQVKAGADLGWGIDLDKLK